MNYVLKHEQDIFFLFNIQNVKSNSHIIFLKFFPIIFFWWKMYSSQLYLFIKGLIFVILSECFPISSWFNAIVIAFWKHLSFFIDEIYCCFFGFYPIRRIYTWSTMIMTYFMAFIIQQINIIEDKLTMLPLF